MSKPYSKELVVTRPEAEEVASSKPYLIRIKDRYLCSDGRYHTDLIVSYIMEHGRKRWIPIAELSRTFAGANTTDGKRRARKRMTAALRALLAKDEFLVYHTGANGRIEAVKLYDASLESERQAAEFQLIRMEKARQLSAEKVEQAYHVIGVCRKLASERNPVEASL